MTDYKVGVELTLTGTIMQALAMVAGAQGLGAVLTAAKNVETAFAGWSAVLVGGAGIAIGASVLGALNAVAKQADKTQHAIAQLRVQNLPVAEFEKSVEHAQNIGMKLGVKPDVSQEALNKIQSMVSNPEAARHVLEPVLRMGKILESFDKGGVEQVYPIVRMLEETNLITDPGRRKDLDKILDRLEKVLSQSGGTINPTQIQLSNVYARGARFGFTSPEALAQEHPFFTDILPYYAQMSGRAGQGGGGAALMSMWSKIHGQGISKQERQLIESFGLWDQQAKQFKDAEKFDINPYEWVQNTLVPHLKEKGYTDSFKQQSAINSIIQHLFRTRLAADPATEFTFGGRGYRGAEAPFEQHMGRLGTAMGGEAVEEFQRKSPIAAMQRLSAEWDTLWNVIGKSLSQDRINIILGLSNAIQDLAEKISKVDPNTIHNVAKAIAAIAAAFTGAGIAAMTGWPGMITALGVAAYETSPKVKDLADKMGSNLLTAFKGIAGAASDAANALTPFWEKLKEIATKLGIIAPPSKETPYTDYYNRHHKPGPWDPGHFGLKPGEPLPGLHPGDLLHRSSYAPSGGDKPVTINNTIYLDGAAIARAVHDYMISGVEHPSQADRFDGRAGYTSPAHQPITT